MNETAAATHPPYYRAAVIMQGDVIEIDGQPWRVTAGHSAPRTRRLVCKHAHFPARRRVIRPWLDTRVRMLAPYTPL